MLPAWSVLGVAGCYLKCPHDDRELAPLPVREVGHNGHVVARTSIATILHFPRRRPREPWVPRQARQSAVDDIEFYWLKPIQHLCNPTCRPLTLWPCDCYGPPWAGREAWVTYGDGRTREMPANTAKGSRPLLTLLPRHDHMRIVRHYHASYLLKAPSSCSTCLTSSAAVGVGTISVGGFNATALRPRCSSGRTRSWRIVAASKPQL